MSFIIDWTDVTALTLRASVQKISSAGMGDQWNFNTGAFVSAGSGTFTNRSTAMTEGASEYAGSYTVLLPTFAAYTGDVLVRVHSTASSNRTVGAIQVTLVNGTIATDAASPVVVGRDRTFVMRHTSEGAAAPNIVNLVTDKSTTLAFDFSKFLNPGTGISAGGVQVLSGSAITQESVLVSQDRQKLHLTLQVGTTGSRTLLATVTTTDGQQLTGLATIDVN